MIWREERSTQQRSRRSREKTHSAQHDQLPGLRGEAGNEHRSTAETDADPLRELDVFRVAAVEGDEEKAARKSSERVKSIRRENRE
jgi:hypothetical protein